MWTITAVIQELLELTQLSLILFTGRKSQEQDLSCSQVACPKHMQELIFVQTFQEKISFELTKEKDIILQNIRANRNGFHNWRLRKD